MCGSQMTVTRWGGGTAAEAAAAVEAAAAAEAVERGRGLTGPAERDVFQLGEGCTNSSSSSEHVAKAP
jgi:hypothetical protein